MRSISAIWCALRLVYVSSRTKQNASIISSTDPYLCNLHWASNKCILVVLTVVANLRTFSTPPATPLSNSTKRPLGKVTRISTNFSVELETKSLMVGAIFFPCLSTPPSTNPSRNVKYGMVHVPTGNSVIRI